MVNKELILHLSLINGIGIRTIMKLCKESFVDSLYNFKIIDFINCGFSENSAKKIYEGLLNKAILNQELELLLKHNIEYISYLCEDYPLVLLEGLNPPPVLYIEGNKEILKKKLLCVVSSRKTTSYGIKVIDTFLKKMSEDDTLNKVGIVSGGAIGGDKAIHEAALKYGLKTIAIIGSGLLEKYPSSNEKLFNDIIKNDGVILSPFSLQTKASVYTFPNRNYILAGLSKATLIIEAAFKSGTLVTAEAALNANRNVGVVPGPIFSEFSFGGYSLLKQGASLVSSVQDIADLLEIKLTVNNNPEVNNNINNDPYLKIKELAKDFVYVSDIVKKINLKESEIETYLFSLLLKQEAKQDFLGRWKIIV